MSSNNHTNGRLQAFEKNRYFAAKLMTARDMLAEQDYHADRIEAIARHVLGSGVVSGLAVDTLAMDGDGLSATVPPGFAIDPSGDLIVVPESDEVKVLNASDDRPISGSVGDRLAVYLRYDECSVERVPLPGSENACKQECTYNRIVESFSLVCRELSTQNVENVDNTLLERELGLSEVSFPDLAALEDSSSVLTELEELTRIAREFTPADRTEGDETTTGDVFLGIFASDQPGSWKREYSDLDGAFVATNELLYASIAQHAADYENPHGTTLTVSASDDDSSQGQPPLVRVRDDEWAGSAVNFLTDGSLSITGEANGRETPDSLTFDVDWTQLAGQGVVVESLQDEAGNEITGDVSVTSNWLNIVTDSNTDPTELSLDRGSLVLSLGGVEPDSDGKVELTSSDGSIAINTEPSTVDLQVTDPVSAERDALAVYVRDKTLKYTIEAFHDVIHQYGSYSHAKEIVKASKNIMERAGKALDLREFTDQVEFAEAVFEIYKNELRIREELERSRPGGDREQSLDLATDESYEDYDNAVTALETAFGSSGGNFTEEFFEETSATELAVLQDQVAETATWLEVHSDERLALREHHTTDARILKDIVGRTPTPVKTRKFELGELVVDETVLGDQEQAVVIENAKEMASEWTVTEGDTEWTVAADDTNTAYPDEDLVVLVSYIDDLGDASQEIDGPFKHWRASDPDDLFYRVMDKEVPFYAFPESRLESVNS